jgi:DNA-binding MarR family transcriptional regulator
MSAATTDYIATMGGAALGAYLRRLSAAIDTDAARVYAALGLRFEQRWFGPINQLALHGPMSVTRLAEALGISQPSVSQARNSLESAGLVQSAPDPEDLRSRILTLTPAGAELVGRLRPLWDTFDEVARQLDDEAGQAAQTLARLEQALGRKSLYARIMDRIDLPQGASASEA